MTSLIWIPIIDAGRSRIKEFVTILLTSTARQNISVVDVATMLLMISVYFDTRMYINGSLVFLVFNWVYHRYVTVDPNDSINQGIIHVHKLEQICEHIYGLSNKVPNYHIRRRFYRLLNKYGGNDFNKESLVIMPVIITTKTDPGTEGNQSQLPLVRIFDEIGNVRVLNNKPFHECTLRSVDDWGLIDNTEMFGNSIIECKYDKSKGAQTYMVESNDKIFIITCEE